MGYAPYPPLPKPVPPMPRIPKPPQGGTAVCDVNARGIEITTHSDPQPVYQRSFEPHALCSYCSRYGRVGASCDGCGAPIPLRAR